MMVTRKRARHSRRMRYPQFYVSGKSPMGPALEAFTLLIPRTESFRERKNNIVFAVSMGCCVTTMAAIWYCDNPFSQWPLRWRHNIYIYSFIDTKRSCSRLMGHNGRDGVSNDQPHDRLYSTVYSGTDLGKYQSSTSLAFVRGIHR